MKTGTRIVIHLGSKAGVYLRNKLRERDKNIGINRKHIDDATKQMFPTIKKEIAVPSAKGPGDV